MNGAVEPSTTFHNRVDRRPLSRHFVRPLRSTLGNLDRLGALRVLASVSWHGPTGFVRRTCPANLKRQHRVDRKGSLSIGFLMTYRHFVSQISLAATLAATLATTATAQDQPVAPTPPDAPAQPMADQTPVTPAMAAQPAPAGQTAQPTIVTNGPVADTPQNRAKYGRPLSHAGQRSHPVGN